MEKKSPFCTLTDQELIEKVTELIQQLIDTGGKSWVLNIPARPNSDPDLIFTELNFRFKNLIERPQPGPMWVKASKRLPDSWHLKCVRFIHTKLPLVDAERWLKDTPEAIASVEWLDESPAEQPVADTEQPGAMIYPDLKTEALEHAKIITSDPEHQLYVAQGYYNAISKHRAEQPLREEDNKLIEAQAEYIQLLGDELNEVVGMIAARNGWLSTRVEQGKRLREKIDSLYNQLNEQKERPAIKHAGTCQGENGNCIDWYACERNNGCKWPKKEGEI